MNCKFCTADVPPQWIFTINMNLCPSCGGQLMDDAAMKTLGEIREAINDMPNNPEGLAGWLMSHYKLEKFGTAESTEFHQRQPGQNQRHPSTGFIKHGNPVVEAPHEGPVPGGAALVNKFLKRAGVKVPNQENLKGLVAQIKSGDMDGGIDPRMIAAMQSHDGSDDAGDISVEGSHITDADDYIVDAFSSGQMPANPQVQITNMKRQQVQQEMRNSGSVGKISRSS